MNILSKKLVAIGVCICLITCLVPVMAQGNFPEESTAMTDDTENVTEAYTEVVTEPVEPGVYELSLEDAINMALENNPQIAAADAAITSAELSLVVINDTQKDFDKMAKKTKVAVKIPDGIDTAYLLHGYYPLAGGVGLDLAVMEKDKITASVAYDVTQKYFNVKLMEKLVVISQASLELVNENAEVMRKNYELGFVSQLEVRNAENAVTQAEFSLQSNQRNLEIALESLKISLHLDGTDCVLILTDEIVIPQLPENPEELIGNAVDTRYDMTALRKTYELSEKYFDITKLYMNDSTSKYHTTYSDFLSKQYSYENTKKLITLSLRNDYASILTARDNITVAQNNLNVKQTEYDSAVIKYEMGIITNLELTAVMAELDSCRVQLENANLTYLLAVLKFGYNTTIGI